MISKSETIIAVVLRVEAESDPGRKKPPENLALVRLTLLHIFTARVDLNFYCKSRSKLGTCRPAPELRQIAATLNFDPAE